MLPFSLFLIGAALAVYCLWQLRRGLEQAESTAAAGWRRLGNLADELVATAETTVSVVAEKAEELGGLIAQADERLARLEAAVAAPVAQGAGAALATAPVAPVALAAALATAPVAAPVAAPGVGPAGRPGRPDAQRELYTKVYALADAGQDVTSIARTLNIAKGEVQLILGLRPAT